MSTSFEPFIVALVLLAALMHASWNGIVKTGGDGLLMFVLIKVPTMVIAAAVLLVTGLPSAASVPYAIGSAAGFTAYCFLLIWAYRMGDLNFVYPVARGTAPLGVALLSGLLLGERLSGTGLVGIMVISAGIAALALLLERVVERLRVRVGGLRGALCGTLHVVRVRLNSATALDLAHDLQDIPLCILAYVLCAHIPLPRVRAALAAP